MKKIYSKIKYFLSLLGFNPTVFVNFFRGLPVFCRDLKKIKRQMKKVNDQSFSLIKIYPMMGCRYTHSGTMKGHYFHQDLHVAKRIFENNPRKHVDIGSRIDGFISSLAVFREVEVFDIRPQTSPVENILFTPADMMQLPENLVNYCDSLSSLHAIEHFGLGRYGDPIDIFGHLKALDNIFKILQPGGKFYFSVPIGKQRIEFNGHRVFNVSYLIDQFKEKYSIDFFSYIDDYGDFNKNIEITNEGLVNNFNCYYGCGVFELTKCQ